MNLVAFFRFTIYKKVITVFTNTSLISKTHQSANKIQYKIGVVVTGTGKQNEMKQLDKLSYNDVFPYRLLLVSLSAFSVIIFLSSSNSRTRCVRDCSNVLTFSLSC